MSIKLRSLLGTKLVAYLSHTPETATVRRWAADEGPLPSQAALDRIQVALDATQRITARDDPTIAQTWFQAGNPTLNDQPPAQLQHSDATKSRTTTHISPRNRGTPTRRGSETPIARRSGIPERLAAEEATPDKLSAGAQWWRQEAAMYAGRCQSRWVHPSTH